MNRSHLLQIITAVVLAATAVVADQTSDESNEIAKVELLGGKVMRNEALRERPSICIDFQGSKRFSEKHLHLLKSLRNLTTLILDGTRITDDSLKELGELKTLKELWVNGTQISNEGLTKLKESLPNTTIHDR